MDKKNINLDFEIRFQKVQELNPSFDLARVAVAYHGLNRNHSIISKDVFENAKQSMYNIPVVGRYIPETDDFGSHDIQVIENDDGLSIEAATVPFGVVPESAVIGWDIIEEDDGTKREYLTTDCLIWKRSYGYKRLVSQDKWSQSMEITVNDCEFDNNDIMVIKDMTFNALCILGNDVEPCFESANIQFSVSPTNEEFKNNFSLMLGELKELTAEMSKENDKNIKEGGCNELDAEVIEFENVESEAPVEETVYSEDIVEQEESFEDNAEEESEVVEPAEDVVDNTSSEEGYTKDETKDDYDPDENDEEEDEDKYTLNSEFSRTYNEMRDTLCEALNKLSGADIDPITGNVVGETCYYLSDFDDEYIYATVCKYTADSYYEECARIAYKLANDVCNLCEPEQMFVRWLTAAENEAIEMERNELLALREYKCEEEEKKHRFEIDEFVNKEFADIIETAEYSELGESIYSMEKDILTEKLYAIRGKHATYSYSLDEKEVSETEEFKIPVSSKTSDKPSRYGSLFATYAMNK